MHDPNFSREGASQGDVAVAAAQAIGGVRAVLEPGGVCEWVTSSEVEFGSCGTMTLQGFSLGSAADVLDDEAG